MKIKQVITIMFKSDDYVTDKDVNTALEELQTTYIVYQILESHRGVNTFSDRIFMKLLVEEKD